MSPETCIESSRVSAADGAPSGAGSAAAGEEAAGAPHAVMRTTSASATRERTVITPIVRRAYERGAPWAPLTLGR
jgi:hypothetical protein